ncbi:hypothetical protein MMC16_000901 [Acarospora aff. strigata]|nr:hypothetical protein [Acarospora aff. strigata]
MASESLHRHSRHELGESWVVESDEDSGSPKGGDPRSSPLGAQDTYNITRREYDKVDRASPTATVPRRTSRNTARESSEPDLVMPSIHEDIVDGSWVSANGRNLREQPKRRAVKSATPAGGRPGRPSTKGPDKATKANERDYAESPLDELAGTVAGMLRSMLGWIVDVFGKALRNLKTPISWLVAGYIFVGFLFLLKNLMFSSVYSALSPICKLPGSSLLNLPMCHSPISVNYKGEQRPPVEFDQLMTVQSKFEEVLEESAGGVSLPLDMKRGETSIRDLRQVVRFSQLHSKNELVLEFDGFIETARIASYDLQKFNSHVGRGVDNILATARWTKRVLDDIAIRDSSRGTLQTFGTKLLAPFQPLQFTADALLDQYIQHTRIVEDEIHRLIAEAQALLQVLQNLEDRLDVIHGIATRDNTHAQTSKDEILTHLWTQLGGNRRKLGKYDSQLRLLDHVGEYRRSAWAHVSGTILKLQAMGAELEELRERVGSAELLRDTRADVPLAVHIENIELGVERLEAGREKARGVEKEYLRRTLDRGRDGEGDREGAGRMIDGR